MTFLTAEWRKLAIANYKVDSAILEKYLPYKTELDFWNDCCYVSLVGFMFLNTRLKGFHIPFHSDFEEVNLRFYVRYKENNQWKRGVVFIKEIVPKPAITIVANVIYKENYQTLPMKHDWVITKDEINVKYEWKYKEWNSFEVNGNPDSQKIAVDSEEEFITEHYWGYTRINSEKTSGYEVTHPRWKVFPVNNYKIKVNFGDVYGKDFSFLNHQKPMSVFLAEGSEIAVHHGKIIQ